MKKTTLLIAFLLSTILARANDLRFEHIRFQTTAAYITAKSICEDQYGFIWIGTNRGLYRFDGYMAVEITATNKGLPLNKHYVESVAIDKMGGVWCATNHGLYLYDRVLNELTLIEKTKGISCNVVLVLPSEEIAIGSNSGLFIFTHDGEFVEQYNNIKGLSSTLSHSRVRSIFVDSSNRLWVGTFDGLNKIDREKNTIQHYYLNSDEGLDGQKNNLILDIKQLDKTGRHLAIGTESGLSIFDTANEQYTTIDRALTNNCLSNNVIKTVCIDNDNVWCGTDYGLNNYNTLDESINSYVSDFYNSRSISGNIIWNIFKDSQSNLWVATDNGVDLLYNSPTAKGDNRVRYTMPPMRGGVMVNNLVLGRDGDVWYATNQGVIKYDNSSQEYETIAPPDILHNKVNDILYTNDGFVWIATEGGLNLLDEKNGEIDSYVTTKKGDQLFANNYIYKLRQSKSRDIWSNVLNNAVYKISRDTSGVVTSTNFRHKANNNSISSNSIFDIEFDSQDNIWFANTQGVDRFNCTTGQFNLFTISERDVNSEKQVGIKALSIGYDNEVYISTNIGAYRLDEEAQLFHLIEGSANYDINDIEAISKTLQLFVSNNSLYILDNDRLYRIPNRDFGFDFVVNIKRLEERNFVVLGNTGFALLNVDDYTIPDNVTPKVHWTHLRVNGQTITPNVEFHDRSVVEKDIDYCDQIVLKHNENVISIGISSLQYGFQRSIRYKYMLEGSSNQWNETGMGDSEITFNYLNPGRYKLRVKAPNKYGEYTTDEKVLSIIIAPPIHLSIIAIILYILFSIILGSIAIVRFKKSIVEKEHILKERERQQLDRKKSEELIEIKSRFFTNISHELKTPLTLISGPIDDMLRDQDISELKRKRLMLSKRNIDRLKRLVNQILDFRRIEKQAESLEIRYYDIVEFCSRIVTLFNEEAIRDNIYLSFHSSIKSKYLWFDSDKVDKIIFNLLSNAIKFTKDGGKIDVDLTTIDDYLVVSVRDTGCGIPAEYVPHIFDRFNTNNSKNHTAQSGSGIGLSLVKEYVEMHNGSIKVDSEEEVGTTFTFTLPLNKLMLKDYTEMENAINIKEVEEVEGISYPDKSQILDSTCGTPTILVVEDNYDMREYISDYLSAYYTVYQAQDGVEGLSLAIQHLPNLIISDIMMPNMDGLELCRRIRSDIRCSDIPLILLTAKSDTDSKKKGINIGANGYVAKPFDMEYLLAKANSLIEQRGFIEKSLRLQHIFTPSELSIENTDEKFIENLVSIIEQEIDNPELNTTYLSTITSTNSTTLYRKVKNITNLTLCEFIRSVRLKRAGQLLRNSRLNVSEIMFMVGFSNRSYFTRTFKEFFGLSPREYQRQEIVEELEQSDKS